MAMQRIFLLATNFSNLPFLFPHSGIKEWSTLSKQKLLNQLQNTARPTMPNVCQTLQGRQQSMFFPPSSRLWWYSIQTNWRNWWFEVTQQTVCRRLHLTSHLTSTWNMHLPSHSPTSIPFLDVIVPLDDSKYYHYLFMPLNGQLRVVWLFTYDGYVLQPRHSIVEFRINELRHKSP